MAFYPSTTNYQKIELTGNIVLDWPYGSIQGAVTITNRMNVQPDLANRNLILPKANETQTGQTLTFNNISAYSFNLCYADGSVFFVVSAGAVIDVYVTDSTTSNGIWSVISHGLGASAISALTINDNDVIKFLPNNIIAPGGTINTSVSDTIKSCNNIKTLGYVVAKTLNENQDAVLQFGTNLFVEGDNINLTNTDGIEGNTVISLKPILTGLEQLVFTGYTQNEAGVTINTDATYSLGGIVVDDNRNISNINNLQISGIISNNNLPKANCTFSSIVSGNSTQIDIQGKDNIASILLTSGIYLVTFENPMLDNNYGILFSAGIDGTLPTLNLTHPRCLTKASAYFSFVVVDSAGELLFDAPAGITLAVISNATN